MANLWIPDGVQIVIAKAGRGEQGSVLIIGEWDGVGEKTQTETGAQIADLLTRLSDGTFRAIITRLRARGVLKEKI